MKTLTDDLTIDDIDAEAEHFQNYLRLKKNLTQKVVRGYVNRIKRFLLTYHGILSPATIEGYLTDVKRRLSLKTYANYLLAFKRYIRDYKGLDYMDEYEFPHIAHEPVIIPTRQQLATFFHHLPQALYTKQNQRVTHPKYHALFLFLASSGLRLGEALSVTKQHLDLTTRMVIPASHETIPRNGVG